MKTIVLAALALLTLGASLPLTAAYPPPPGAYRPVQSVDQPTQLLKKKLNRIKEFMQTGGEHDPVAIMLFLQDEVVEHIDLGRMAQWIAGPYYPRMNDEEQNKFQQQLKEKIFMALSEQLNIFKDQQLQMNFYPPRQIGPAEVAIALRILPPSQSPMRIVFNFHYEDEKDWKVYDISLNGLSAIAHYRSFYRQAARQFGSQAFYE